MAAWGEYEPPAIPGVAWREGQPQRHGPWQERIWPGRRVVAVIDGILQTWPAASPEECADEEWRGRWIAGGQILVCPGCGLDAT